MVYFKAAKKNTASIKIIAMIVTFIVIILVCVYTTDSLSRKNIDTQKSTIENALMTATIQFYALEGYYPANLTELLSDYPIVYDEDRFFIDYQPVAANIMPDISVIIREQ